MPLSLPRDLSKLDKALSSVFDSWGRPTSAIKMCHKRLALGCMILLPCSLWRQGQVHNLGPTLMATFIRYTPCLSLSVPAPRHHRAELRLRHEPGDPRLPQAGELPRHRHVVQAALGRPQAQEQRRAGKSSIGGLYIFTEMYTEETVYKIHNYAHLGME